jgi:hypothetical protein
VLQVRRSLLTPTGYWARCLGRYLSNGGGILDCRYDRAEVRISDGHSHQPPDRSAKPFENWSSGAAYQFAQGLKVPDDERAAPSFKNTGGAPEGELLIDRLPASPDHLSQIVLRYWDSDVALF